MQNIFGTDGIRAKVGDYPLRTTQLIQLGSAIARWAYNKHGSTVQIIIGNDTRVSASHLKSSILSGITRSGTAVHDVGMLSTPALVSIVSHMSPVSVGIMLTASHNPYYDNGIKVIDPIDIKLSAIDEQLISDYFHSVMLESHEHLSAVSQRLDLHTMYTDYLLSFFPRSYLQGVRVLLDCAHGALSDVAPAVFEMLGAQVICYNNKPDGYNINDACGAVYPEVLQKKMLEHAATIGFSFDGDADRVIALNAQGTIKDGDDILAALLDHCSYKKTTCVVGTVMSNTALEHYCNAKNYKFVRTDVGDKHVIRSMLYNDALLGAEPSGHVIARDYLLSGDGLFVALRLCQALLNSGNWSMNHIIKYPQIITNIPIPIKNDIQACVLEPIIKHAESLLDNGRILIRRSGTQNLLRIMVESDNNEQSNAISCMLTKSLSTLITTLCYNTDRIQ